jgi:hypothetical protein
MKGIKISLKISVLVILISLVAVVAISFFTYDLNLQTNREKITNNLNVITENRAAQINVFFDKIKYNMSLLQSAEKLKGGGSSEVSSAPADFGFDMPDTSGDSATETTGETLEDFLVAQKDILGFDHLYITSTAGAIATSTDDSLKTGNFQDPDGTSFEHGAKGVHFSDVSKEKKDYFLFVIAPLEATNQLIIAKLKLNDLYKSLTDHHGLGQSGEIILVKQNSYSKKIIFVSPLRSDPDATLKMFESDDSSVKDLRKAFEGNNGSGSFDDYRDVECLQVWHPWKNGSKRSRWPGHWLNENICLRWFVYCRFSHPCVAGFGTIAYQTTLLHAQYNRNGCTGYSS